MKLSELFKERKISFYTDEDGRVKTKIIEPLPQGEIIFNHLNSKMIESLKKEDSKQTDYNYIYDILDKITNVEKDVSKKDFVEAMLLSPNSAFELFKEQVFAYLVDTMKKFNKTSESYAKYAKELSKEADTMNKKMEETKKLIPQKSDEDKLKELQKQIENEKDSKKKKELVFQAYELAEKINKKSNINKLEQKKQETENKIAETEKKIKEFNDNKQKDNNNIVDISYKSNDSNKSEDK